MEPALREARKLKDRTVFMDFRTDPTENVWPMVKAGKGITEMLLGSEDLIERRGGPARRTPEESIAAEPAAYRRGEGTEKRNRT